MTCQLLLPLFSLHPMEQRTFGVQASASFSACPKLVICCCNFVKMQENSGWFHHQHLPAGSTRTLLCGNCHAEMNRFFSEEHCVLFCGAKGILLSLVMQDKSWFFSTGSWACRPGADTHVMKWQSRQLQAKIRAEALPLYWSRSELRTSLSIIGISARI